VLLDFSTLTLRLLEAAYSNLLPQGGSCRATIRATILVVSKVFARIRNKSFELGTEDTTSLPLSLVCTISRSYIEKEQV